jgi:hypothetical protein
MRGAVIRKGSHAVEGMCEDRALIENRRVPEPVGHPWSARGTAVTGRAPGPSHCVALVNRHG